MNLIDRLKEAYQLGKEEYVLLDNIKKNNPRLKEISAKVATYNQLEIIAYDAGFKNYFG